MKTLNYVLIALAFLALSCGSSETADSIPNEDQTSSSSNEAFSYLTKIDMGYGVSIAYKPEVSKLINKGIDELDKTDPLYFEENHEGASILITTKIAAGGANYHIVYSSGPSADPSFAVYKDGDKEPIKVFYALEIAIPGNGNIYTAGHTNNMFNNRKKYQLKNNKLVEAEQAFYYVGLKSKTLKPITLYKSERLRTVVASLPADYKVEVLINKPKTDLYLVRTEFGLTGWVALKNQMYGNISIDKLFYAGD